MLAVGEAWQSQGNRNEACDLLASVYNGFTEGFDTIDVLEAKALLEEVARIGILKGLFGQPSMYH